MFDSFGSMRVNEGVWGSRKRIALVSREFVETRPEMKQSGSVGQVRGRVRQSIDDRVSVKPSDLVRGDADRSRTRKGSEDMAVF